MMKNNIKMISFFGDGIPTFVGMTQPQDRKEVSVSVGVKRECDCHSVDGKGHLFNATNPFSVIPAKCLPPRRRGAGTF